MTPISSHISEKIPVEVFPEAQQACNFVADAIVETIRARTANGQTTVLGLATGSTPLKLYRRLIELYASKQVSFKNVITFNLDEYLGLPPCDPNSYHYFMRSNLFDHIDILPENTHIPSGMTADGDIARHCADYEKAIAAAGGIDIQILGIGRTGHIGFNEPGSPFDSITRQIDLNPVTRQDAAPAFGGLEQVPTHAITMGIGTILRARRIFMLAWGKNKAEILMKAVRETPSTAIPATCLQSHPQTLACIDTQAAAWLLP